MNSIWHLDHVVKFKMTAQRRTLTRKKAHRSQNMEREREIERDRKKKRKKIKQILTSSSRKWQTEYDANKTHRNMYTWENERHFVFSFSRSVRWFTSLHSDSSLLPKCFQRKKEKSFEMK